MRLYGYTRIADLPQPTTQSVIRIVRVACFGGGQVFGRAARDGRRGTQSRVWNAVGRLETKVQIESVVSLRSMRMHGFASCSWLRLSFGCQGFLLPLVPLGSRAASAWSLVRWWSGWNCVGVGNGCGNRFGLSSLERMVFPDMAKPVGQLK